MKRILAILLLACCFMTACGQKPGSPRGLSVSLKDGAAVISWDKSTEANTYRLYRRTAPEVDFEFIFDADSKATSYTDRFVKGGKQYTYKLEIIGKDGISDSAETDISVPEKGTGKKAEAPKTPVISSVTKMDPYTAVVSVEAQKDCTYEFYRCATSDGEYKICGTAKEPYLYDVNSNKKTDWYYRVRVVKGEAASKLSEPQKTGYKPGKVFDVPILMYHEFVTAEDLENGIAFDEYAIYQDEFESDLKWLSENGYTTITSLQLADYLSGKGTLPEKPIILSIDDGKYGVYKRAWPLLKKYKMKAVLALIGYEIDNATSAPAARSQSEAPYCTWDEIAEMSESGAIEMISHTDKQHYYLHDGRNGASTKEGDTLESFLPIAQKDYSDASRSFRTHLNTIPTTMAYPYSKRTPLSDEAWLKSGFRLLFAGDDEDVRLSGSNFFVREAGLNLKSAVLRRVARMTKEPIKQCLEYM